MITKIVSSGIIGILVYYNLINFVIGFCLFFYSIRNIITSTNDPDLIKYWIVYTIGQMMWNAWYFIPIKIWFYLSLISNHKPGITNFIQFDPSVNTVNIQKGNNHCVDKVVEGACWVYYNNNILLNSIVMGLTRLIYQRGQTTS